MDYTNKIYTAPTEEPVTIFEAKQHLRIDVDDDNTLIGGLIVAARQWCEAFTRRQLCTATWQQFQNAFPRDGGPIKLYFPPLASVTYIKYYDGDGTQQTLSTSYYTVDTACEPGRCTLNWGYYWPVTRAIYNAVEIKYVCGYGTAADVPQSIKQAMLLLIANMYEFREPEVSGTIVSKVGFAVESLLTPYRLYEFV